MANQGITVQANAWADTWAHQRDHARPVKPEDVGQLEVVREQLPPSRAHVKRLKRARPEVSTAKPQPPRDCSARRAFNEAHKLGLAVAKLHLPNRHASAHSGGIEIARSNWSHKS